MFFIRGSVENCTNLVRINDNARGVRPANLHETCPLQGDELLKCISVEAMSNVKLKREDVRTRRRVI